MFWQLRSVDEKCTGMDVTSEDDQRILPSPNAWGGSKNVRENIHSKVAGISFLRIAASLRGNRRLTNKGIWRDRDLNCHFVQASQEPGKTDLNKENNIETSYVFI